APQWPYRRTAPRRGRTGQPGVPTFHPTCVSRGHAGLAARGIRLVRHPVPLAATCRCRRGTGAKCGGLRCRGSGGRSGTKRRRSYPAPILRLCRAFAHRGDFTSGKHIGSEPKPAPSRAAPGSLTPASRAGLDIFLGDRRRGWHALRSEEHTSELQSRGHLVCRLLLEKKKVKTVAS